MNATHTLTANDSIARAPKLSTFDEAWNAATEEDSFKPEGDHSEGQAIIDEGIKMAAEKKARRRAEHNRLWEKEIDEAIRIEDERAAMLAA